jgi:hypothetical protein
MATNEVPSWMPQIWASAFHTTGANGAHGGGGGGGGAHVGGMPMFTGVQRCPGGGKPF